MSPFRSSPTAMPTSDRPRRSTSDRPRHLTSSRPRRLTPGRPWRGSQAPKLALPKLALAVLAIAATLALSACGDSHTKVTGGTYAGESGANAPYLNVGPLTYEVQISRELNPYDTEDSGYLSGLTPAQRHVAPGEEWFAVFLQVYNTTEVPHMAASARSMTITDTQANLYRPTIPAPTNPFAYTAGYVPAKGRLPELNTIAASGPTQGLLLLYKIKIASLDNRPLKLHIIDPLDPSQTASAELDV